MLPLNSKPRRHILLVDDDAVLRNLLGLILTREGYTVSHASNGQQAISLHRSRPCDLFITELTLGGRGSFETIMELRRQPAPVKFIATARRGWMPPDFCLRMAKHLGAYDVLAKPFQAEEMIAVVRSALQ
ncbi:MAG TPA: response regulator [Verrucomicrobiae bacterium]|nr:response regulator [Verrucomicrobiae bacterium]